MEELKKIKKMYGEKFMQMSRTLFPTLLETEGKLYEILTTYFSNNSRTLYEDITENGLENELKEFIYSKINGESPSKKIVVDKTPYQLLDEAGYVLKECKSERQIQQYRKYYSPGEELCTFDGGRLNRCYVFFAVRKDVEDIRREDFDKPRREDKYGTSVMGIQFNKEGRTTVSIKNRYNHRVNNPDATYGNNLDRIVPGLTHSFGQLLQKRGLELDTSNIEYFEIPNYVVANDGKYYKYNMEIDGTYYCPGNVVIKDGEVQKIENPEKKILMDYFVLDLENKTIELYDKKRTDSFTDNLQDIEKIEISKDKEKKTKKIIIQKKEQEQPITIELDQDNQIIGYQDSTLTQAGKNFLVSNKALTQLDVPNLQDVGDGFLESNQGLEQLDLPNVKSVGNYFLQENIILKQLNMPNVKKIGDDFLSSNIELTELNFPSLEYVGDGCLNLNTKLRQLNMPNTKSVGAYFLPENRALRRLEMRNLIETGAWFVGENEELRELIVPNLEEIDDESFLHRNRGLRKIDMPYRKGLTERLSKIINKNKVKTIIMGDGSKEQESEKTSEQTMPVGESKFAEIYCKAKGGIKKVFEKIKSFIKGKSNDKNNDEKKDDRE